MDQRRSGSQRVCTVFSMGDGATGLTMLGEHGIPVVEGTRPIRLPPHRLENFPPRLGFIRERTGRINRWCLKLFSGAKKKDGKWRLCIGYRQLNTATQQYAYSLPPDDDSSDALPGNKSFSTLGLVSGYWQMPLDADAQEKSAFITSSGLWKWQVLPFGLTLAPITFQWLIDRKSLLLDLVNIIVIAPNFQTYLQRVEEVFQCLKQGGLKLKPNKCELLQKEVKYLGHFELLPILEREWPSRTGRYLEV